MTPVPVNNNPLVKNWCGTIIFGTLAAAAVASTIAVISVPLCPIITAGVGVVSVSCIALILMYKIEKVAYENNVRRFKLEVIPTASDPTNPFHQLTLGEV
jgi:hypothetical protein